MTTVYFKKGLAKYKTSDSGGGGGRKYSIPVFALFFFFFFFFTRSPGLAGSVIKLLVLKRVERIMLR